MSISGISSSVDSNQGNLTPDVTPNPNLNPNVSLDDPGNDIQAEINAILNGPRLPDGEYNLANIGNVFMLMDQLYSDNTQTVIGNMNSTTTLINDGADVQNIFKKENISLDDANDFVAKLKDQYDIVAALHAEGKIDDSTYQQMNGSNGVISQICKYLDPSVIQSDGSLDFSKGEQPIQVAANISALWQANNGNGNNAPSPAAQQAMSDVNQAFVTGQNATGTVSTNLKSLFTYYQKQDQTAQTQWYNFLSILTHAMTTANSNIQRSN